MRKLTNGLLIAVSALALASCGGEKKEEAVEATAAEASPASSDDATTATDASTDAADPNGNPIKP